MADVTVHEVLDVTRDALNVDTRYEENTDVDDYQIITLFVKTPNGEVTMIVTNPMYLDEL